MKNPVKLRIYFGSLWIKIVDKMMTVDGLRILRSAGFIYVFWELLPQSVV
jgi:hypothetical protein